MCSSTEPGFLSLREVYAKFVEERNKKYLSLFLVNADKGKE